MSIQTATDNTLDDPRTLLGNDEDVDNTPDLFNGILGISDEDFVSGKYELNTQTQEPNKTDVEDLGSIKVTEDVTKTIINSTKEDNSKDKTSTNEENDTLDSNVTEVDYKQEHEKLLAPFKANGIEMKVSSVDEAIKLMQMGANYAKKMQSIKPHMQVIKTLENAKIDSAELNFLIDLKNKNPEAIRKLVQDSGIDPLDLDVSEKVAYTPNNHTVSANVIALDEVISSINSDPHYVQTQKVVLEDLDDVSRSIIVENPQILGVLHQQIGSGIYQQISAEIMKQRMLGNLTGLSDLAAYKEVGDYMQANGLFNQPTNKQPVTSEVTQSVVTQQTQPNSKTVSTNIQAKNNVADKKKAAMPTKQVSTGNASTPNYLAMSDEEFMQHYAGL
jgi:hypothetical protein